MLLPDWGYMARIFEEHFDDRDAAIFLARASLGPLPLSDEEYERLHILLLKNRKMYVVNWFELLELNKRLVAEFRTPYTHGKGE